MIEIYRLKGLDCANCAAKMETRIKKLDGIKRAGCNFLTTKFTVETESELSDELRAQIEDIIHKLEPEVKLEKVK